MFIQDEALIYKQYDSSYYAITKKNGKIILKHFYFKEKYPSIKSLFFINYEYDSHQLKKTENKNYTSLIIQNMELDYIVSLNLIGSTILLFQYILNYCIDYKIEIELIYTQLFVFLRSNINNTDIECNKFLYNLLSELSLLNIESESIHTNNENIYYKNNILKTLISLNPHHSLYIKKITHI